MTVTQDSRQFSEKAVFFDYSGYSLGNTDTARTALAALSAEHRVIACLTESADSAAIDPGIQSWRRTGRFPDFESAAASFGIDLSISCIISSDHELITAAEQKGVFGLQLLDADSLQHLERIPPERLIFHTLESAVSWLSAHPAREDDLHLAIEQGARALKAGRLTAFPTETVYGLGADALNEEAVKLIFKAKQRPFYDPLIVHISGFEQLDRLVTGIPEAGKTLAEKFWPGPLTLVLPKSGLVPDIVTSSHPTVAVRMPSNPWARELISRAGTPVAAPSANLFGRTSPTTAAHVADQLQGTYEVLIDAGACRVGVESTVLSLAGDSPLLLRAGGISREELEAVIGPVEVPHRDAAGNAESPGMLPNHYAPQTRLIMVDDIRDYTANREIGCILYEELQEQFAGPTVTVSRRRNVKEIALGIYAALRELDAMGLKLIAAEWCPDEGVGAAVNDRLRKASAPVRR